jgi:hypothetical protein
MVPAWHALIERVAGATLRALGGVWTGLITGLVPAITNYGCRPVFRIDPVGFGLPSH